jgi:hypothetical protein
MKFATPYLDGLRPYFDRVWPPIRRADTPPDLGKRFEDRGERLMMVEIEIRDSILGPCERQQIILWLHERRDIAERQRLMMVSIGWVTVFFVVLGLPARPRIWKRSAMIRIAITAEAFDAIAATLPLSSGRPGAAQMSDIRPCNPAFESVVRAVRPIIFNTGNEDFPYATHGGTAFVISYKGRPYAVTCQHVFKVFREDQLMLFGAQWPAKGDNPAKIKTVCSPSTPQASAVETDVTDFCGIEFADDVSADFFGGTAYSLSEQTIRSSHDGDRLMIFGAFKDRIRIDPPDVDVGYGRLELEDVGPTSDPFLRKGVAQYLNPEFSTVTGISGAPVFNLTQSGLCGMVLRGGLDAGRLNVRYAEASDILRFIEGVAEGSSSTFYLKRQRHRDT